MTPLGKPLVFYLKHMAEMNCLYGIPEYEDEKPDLTGLDDETTVREMARTVGAAAFEQAADFLELCGERISDHFIGLKTTTLTNKAKRRNVVRDWGWYRKVQVTSVPGGSFYCGVFVSAPPEVQISLEQDVCGVVVPWIWSKGGRKGEDTVWNILGGWPYSRGGEGLVDEKGTVALARIPIKAEPPESFDVDREQLVAEVTEIIGRIGAKQVKAIAKFVAGLKAPDEG
jgi:hypothetical protein